MTTPTAAERAAWRKRAEKVACDHSDSTDKEGDCSTCGEGPGCVLADLAHLEQLRLLDALDEAEKKDAEIAAALDVIHEQAKAVIAERDRAVELLRALLKGPCLEDDAAPAERFLADLDGRKQG